MTRITYVFFMFHVAEGIHAHSEQASPESSHLSGTLQARAVCDLRGKAEAMKPEPLTPTWAQREHVPSVCHATDVRELR